VIEPKESVASTAKTTRSADETEPVTVAPDDTETDGENL